MKGQLQLKLLGTPNITLEGTALTESLPSKAQAILYYLALTGQPQTRTLLAGLLWGDMPEAAARTNLRKALANLRQVVGNYLNIDRSTISFKSQNIYHVDVVDFQTKVGDISASDIELLREAISMYDGDFLSGFYVRNAPDFETWMVAEQGRLREIAVQVLHTLIIHYTETQTLNQGILYARRMLALEPWREESHRQLMYLLASDGQRSAALAQYETCVHTLDEELGVEPGKQTTALYQRIRDGELDLDSTPKKPHHVPDTKPHYNLPAQPTPFIGREKELTDIVRRLIDKDCRLLTLIGPGGIGKTRLALQVAQSLIDSDLDQDFFADGIAFIPMTGVRSTDGMISAIIEAANLSFFGNTPPLQQLLTTLRQKKMLLILDNTEHLLEESASLITEILTAAPEVNILVTSRIAINLQEAWFHPIESMTFPKSDPQLSDDNQVTDPDLETFDAVKLFVQSARRASVTFSLAQEQAQVRQICQLVEGIPLGLELAAAWLKILPVGKIVQEIKQNLDFLSSRHQNLPERHRSMRAVFEHSWRLLNEAERAVLAQLSVFRGNFSQEAAESVANASLMTLATLVEKSLLRVTNTGRYQLHELLRQFAAEKLAQMPDEPQRTKTKYYTYYAMWLDMQDALLRTEDQLNAVHQISADLKNIQSAWWQAVEQEDFACLGQFVWSLWFGHWFS